MKRLHSNQHERRSSRRMPARLLHLLLLPVLLLAMLVPVAPTALSAQAHAAPQSGDLPAVYDVTALDGFTARAINDLGQIAGSVLKDPNISLRVAAVWDNGVVTELLDRWSEAGGINNAGMVSLDTRREAFIYSGGVLTPITPYPEPFQLWAYEINSSGQVASTMIRQVYRPAMLQASGTTYLPSLGWTRIEGGATGINDQGEVAGSTMDATGAFQAVIWSGGVPIALVPSAGRSTALDVNNNRVAVGVFLVTRDPVVEHAFVWRDGQMRDLGVLPGGDYSMAIAINDNEIIVGESNDGQGRYRAVAWVNDQIVNLNDRLPQGSGIVLTKAVDVNNAGQIIAEGWVNGKLTSFLLTPAAGPTIEDVILDQRDKLTDPWQPVDAEGVEEGAEVRITVKIRNTSITVKDAILHVLETVSGANLNNCIQSISVPPTGDGAPYEVTCIWDTGGFAWAEEGTPPPPEPERTLRVTLTPDGGSASTRDVPVRVNPGPQPEIHSVEFTQATQIWQTLDQLKEDLAGDGEPPVPLVAGKPLALRVYFEQPEEQLPVIVGVRVDGEELERRSLLLQPECAPDQMREQQLLCDSADFFFIPPEGAWNVTISTYALSGRLIEQETLTLRSRTLKPIVLEPVTICEITQFPKTIPFPKSICGDASKLAWLLPFFRQLYPTPVVQLVEGSHRLDILEAPDLLFLDRVFWWTELLARTNALWLLDGQPDRYYYGVVSPNVAAASAATGIASGRGGGGIIRAATPDDPFIRIDNETLAHEMGHIFGLEHTPTALPQPPCIPAANFNSDWPYADDTIQELGYNVATRRVYKPAMSYDIMSYCLASQWISPYHYTRLIEALSAGTPAPQQARALATGQFWQVSGVILGSEVTLAPLFTVETVAPSGAGSGAYRVEALDAAGNLLASRAFEPLEGVDATAAGAVPLAFAVLLPFDQAAARIAVRDANGDVRASIDLGGAAPSVTITAPLAGATLSGEQTISWSVSDADSAEHSARVEYSSDGWATRHVLASAARGEFIVDFDQLPGCAGTCQLRVQVSDGALTGEALVTGFSVPEQAPTAQIVAPAGGQVLARGDLAWLQALAHDAGDGYLDGESVRWESSIDGDLGVGASLPVTTLSEGTHTITLSVRDSAGNTATDQITLTVDGTQPELLASLEPNSAAGCAVFSINASDAGGDLATVAYSLNGGQSWTPVAPAALPFEAEVGGNGAFHLLVSVADRAGNTAGFSQRFDQAACQKANAAPVLQVPGEQRALFGRPVNFTVSASDAEDAGELLSFTALELPRGLELTVNGDGTATVHGAALAPAGQHTITISVADSGGRIDTRSVSLVVGQPHAVALPLVVRR